MQVKKAIIRLFIAATLVLPVTGVAQTSSINAFSPYSMYGVGELQTPGTVPTRSMGGAGVAMRSTDVINLLNPASYSVALRRSVLFDFGVEGANFYNSQNRDAQTLRTSYNTFNFRDIALQIPIAKGLGLGFSLTPYSSVGYRMKQVVDDDEIWGNIGQVKYLYEGSGDVTEVKLGMGWELFKNFSVGVAAQYYWGELDRSFTMSVANAVVGDGTYYSSVGSSNYSISRIKGQLGMQWSPIVTDKRFLTLGATYDIGGDLDPRYRHTVTGDDILSTVVKGDTTHLAIVLPNQVSIGAYYMTNKITLALDYVYQNWGSKNNSNEAQLSTSGLTVAYRNTNTVKFGVEWIPNRFDVRHFMKRISYRAGVRYGGYQQSFGGKNINQYAITAGVGIPVKLFGHSKIDVGVEYGSRGTRSPVSVNSKDIGLVKQNYFKFAVGVSLFGDDYWFVRPKYD